MKTKKMIITAMLIALGTVLSLIQVVHLPFGGSITLASMVPIALIGVLYGTKTGLLAGLIYGIIQMMLDPGVIGAAFLPGENQMILWQAILMCVLDYLLAFMVLGLSGVLIRNGRATVGKVVLGTLLATGLRYLVHIASGFILWGSYAEWFFSQEGFPMGEKILSAFSGQGLAMLYSVVYNGFYMIPEIILAVIIVPIVYSVLRNAKTI